MNPDSRFERSILNNLLDGVVIVGLDGIIGTVNPAAARMFGIEPGAVVGKTFAEAFVAIEGFDEFTQSVLDAMVNRGMEGRRVIAVRPGTQVRSLTMTISYMERVAGDRPASMIVLLSDITEIRELRETRIRMARTLEEQNAELKKAYREVEKGNAELTEMLKKVQVARVIATVVVIGLFVGAGAWGWGSSALRDWSGGSDLVPVADAHAPGQLRTVKVDLREFLSEVSLIGRLSPWREVVVSAPIDGYIQSVHFEPGQRVTEGDRLIEFDNSALRLQYQESQVEYQKALNAVNELRNWESGSEVSQALRSYTKAKLALDRQRKRVKESAFLLEEGLIPSTEHTDLELDLENQLLDFEAIEQDLAAARARGGAEARRVARLELDKAESRLRSLEASLRQDGVTAPITGVIQPTEPDQEALAAGQEVKKGKTLFRIADFSRMAVVTRVDEVEVIKLRVGQAVTVRGDAFGGLELSGTVSHVSSQAVEASAKEPVQFEVIATLDRVDEGRRQELRAGMSAHLDIVTYRNPAALMVPLEAVQVRGDARLVRVLDGHGREVEEREVEVGLTTLRAVEVIRGLEAGEEVVLPEPRG